MVPSEDIAHMLAPLTVKHIVQASIGNTLRVCVIFDIVHVIFEE